MRNPPNLKSSILALGTLAVFWTGTVSQAAVVVPPWMMAPAGAVNTNLVGFNVKTVQTDSVLPGDGNADYLTEEMLAPSAPNVAGTAIDPTLGTSADNVVDYTGALNSIPPAVDQYWAVTNVICFERSATAFGAYDGAAIDGFSTTLWPGIPGSNSSYERFACEAITYLYLPAGTNTFIVNTDDDFKLTIGVRANPDDAFRVEAGRFEGGRGTSDSVMSVIVQQAGYYPVRCTYAQGTGGACWVWMSETGTTKILVNDRTNPNAILAYQLPPLSTATVLPPYAVSVTPVPGTQTADPNLVQVVMTNGTIALDTNSLSLSVDGATVAATVSQNTNNQTVISYTPPTLFSPGSTHTAALFFKDQASPANSYTNDWIFTISAYATLTANDAVPTGSVDTTKTGFKVRTSVVDLPYNLMNGVWRAQQQMDGLLGTALFTNAFPNVALTNSASPDGSYTETNLINYNITAGTGADIGDFQSPNFPDAQFPGMPGNAVIHANGTDNAAAEVTAFLDLKPGLYKMIVNSDDGFQVTVGPNFHDALAAGLGTYDTPGGRGASDTTFPFVVSQAGIYPFRLLWENGTGGANLEWAFVDPVSGSKVLINNLTNTPTVIKAYYSGQGRAYISSITPAFRAMTNGFRMAAQDVDPSAPISVQITDAATTVDPSTVKLTLDGTALTVTPTKSGGVTTATYTPSSPLPLGSHHVVQITYTESDGTTRSASWAFNTQQVFTTGVIENDHWNQGSASSDENALYTLPATVPPTFVHYYPQWEAPYPDNNEQGDNYTERLSAYFVPATTADYVFFTSSDDYSELYISPDRDLVNFVRIAAEPQWNNPQSWVNSDRRNSTAPENRSDLNGYVPGTIHLQAGKKYFLMQLHSEGGGGDHEDMLVMRASDVSAPAGGGSGVPDNTYPP
ncbi:MAG: hypothetical protein KGS61_17985, partial [Verrucomicrobia bacterium]|nr:hypothetical protein [Verrucomicrobiota bacterium]